MKTDTCDCLFIAYSGLDLVQSQRLVNYERSDANLECAFNAAIAYLGTYLSRREITFDYINSFEDEKELLINKLKKNTLLVAISSTFCEDIEKLIEIVKFVKKYNKDCKFVIGGTFITYTINQYNENERNIVMRRINSDFYIYSFFGESTLVNLIKALKYNGNVNEIDNLYYKNDNKYMINNIAEEKNILEDNMVDWLLFADRLGIYVPVRTAISCPYKCAYCSFPKYGGKYQTVSIRSIENELDTIAKIGKTGIVHFVDDCFNKPATRFKEILNMLVRNKYPFKWHSFLKCEDIDDDTIYLMKKSGCLGVLIGIESGSPEMLKRMNKSIDLEHIKKTVEKLNKANIVTYALFIVGFPGETLDTVRKTIHYIEELKPTFYALSPWYCNINAPIYDEREKYKIEGKNYNWSHCTMDFKTARSLSLEMFFSIKNSTMLTLNYTYMFQLLYNGVGLEEIKEIVRKGNNDLIINHDFHNKRTNLLKI